MRGFEPRTRAAIPPHMTAGSGRRNKTVTRGCDARRSVLPGLFLKIVLTLRLTGRRLRGRHPSWTCLQVDTRMPRGTISQRTGFGQGGTKTGVFGLRGPRSGLIGLARRPPGCCRVLGPLTRSGGHRALWRFYRGANRIGRGSASLNHGRAGCMIRPDLMRWLWLRPAEHRCRPRTLLCLPLAQGARRTGWPRMGPRCGRGRMVGFVEAVHTGSALRRVRCPGRRNGPAGRREMRPAPIC